MPQLGGLREWQDLALCGLLLHFAHVAPFFTHGSLTNFVSLRPAAVQAASLLPRYARDAMHDLLWLIFGDNFAWMESQDIHYIAFDN